MRTLHKLTHRPLALCALFIGLGVLGWHLPELGSAVFAYSSSAVKAARATISSTPTAAQKVVARTVSAAAKATTTAAPAAVAQSSISQQLDAARAAFEAAAAAARASNSKESRRVVEVARAEVNRLAGLRVAEIKAILNGASQNQSNMAAKADSGPVPNVPNYAALVAELAALGGFPNQADAPVPNQINETEPNNTTATANTLNVAADALAIAAGAVTPVGDVDFYKFTAPANSKVWIYVDTGGTLVSGFRDSQVDLFNTDGTTLIENDDDDGTGNGLDGTVETGFASAIAGRSLTAAGTYFIRVREFDGTSTVDPYKLYVVVTTAATPVVAETEPNDTGATANVLLTAAQTSALATGTVGTGAAANTDFYSITVNAGDLLYANLDGDPERDGVGTDVALSLRDAAGTTILVTSDSINLGSAANPPAENFGFLFTTGGTFTLRVFFFGGQGTYNLMAKVVTPPTIPVCASPITGTLGTATSNFPKASGTATQRVNRDGIVSACGTARTQNAPIAGSFAFDAFTVPVAAGGGPTCITITLNVTETIAPANYSLAAYLNTFNPADLTQNWLGDPGLSTGSPPTQLSFSVIVPQGQRVVIVILNTNGTTGNGNAYSITTSCLQAACVPVCPANITANVAAGTCAATVPYPAATFTGVCNPITCTPASGSTFQKGVTTVTCSSTGNQNGTATCTFTVTVNDNIPPTLVCPADISAGTTGTSQVVTYTNPTGTDNCPPTPIASTCNPPSGSTFALGTTTVTCSVTDAANLTTTCTFRVHINRLTVGSLTDPLACTGPGSKVSGSFTVTNNSNVAQTVAGTVTLGPTGPPQGLLALSCTANAGGTCTIAANQASLTYTTGSLAAGASATVSYILQVNDGVAPGTVLTTSVTASFNGGPAVTAGASTTVNCPLAGPGAPFINNPERTVMSDQRAGSVLFYPIYTSDASGGATQNARISMTNTSDKLFTFVHLFFVDGATCSVSDAFLCLTPNQTTSFLTSDLDPGTRGYIVAVATDANGCPRHFNYLIGDEFVKFSTGHATNLGAEAVPAIAGSTFWVSCDGNQPTSTLRFDSVSYGAVPYTLAADSIGSTADGNNTLLVINRIGGDLQTGPSRLVPIFGTLYDDSEVSYSFNLPTNNLCQYAASLTDSAPRTTPRLSTIIPAGRTGWFKLSGTSEIGIFGAIINFNPNVAASSGAFNRGHNLHKLTFTNAMTYIIPVFPPTC